MQLIPLHIISGYSLLNSGLTIEKIKKQLIKFNLPGCAITDFDTLSGIPPLFEALEKVNKKAVVGIQIYIDDNVLCLFALNETGYKNIIKVISLIEKKLDVKEYLKNNHQGILGILETIRGEYYQKFINEDVQTTPFTSYLNNISKLFEEFYLGVEIISNEGMQYADKVRSFAQTHSYETIAFPRIRYEEKNDAIIIEMLDAIKNNSKLDIKEKDGLEYFLEDKYYQKIYTQREIYLTNEVFSKVNFNLHQKRGSILHYPVDDSKQYLKQQTYAGLKRLNIYDEKHIERIEHELEVINSLHYEDYFLIVQDYVNYAKNNDILVGPGRGSAAGSLVSYALGITEIDPLKYDLQFERFLNSARKTMPDIDVDFMDTRRNDMVQYMREKYGSNHVATIITFQTIKAKQSIRDVGRIFSINESHISLLNKTIPEKEKDITLRQVYKTSPAFKALVDDGEYFLNIVKYAQKIEGLPRQTSNHPAGIILNNSPLDESIPITLDIDGNYLTQYEAPYLEEEGFLKMDFLALSNLTTIYNCIKNINEKENINLDPLHLDFDIPETYKTIALRNTAGIFQLESKGMNQAIAKLKPKCFDDIVALLALYRPGPMEELNTFIARKRGEKFTYASDDLKEILSSTYGIIVYQEQINSIAQKMAGFSKEEADIFRRAVSKKKKEIFKEMEAKFITGAINKGYSKEVSENIFKQLTKFEDYGFNKSHAVVYATIACQMAYLKTKYPLEFYSAILNTKVAVNDNKFTNYLRELHALGYKIIQPSINLSTSKFLIGEKGLIYPLSSIRNMPDIFVDKIIAERENNGTFKSFFDFVLRMKPLGLSESLLHRLIDAGAMDEFAYSRKSLNNAVITAMQRAQLFVNKDGQVSLEGLIPEPKIKQYDDDLMEKLTKEYEALWMTLSNNPLEIKRKELDKKKLSKICNIDDKNAHFAGIVRDIKVIKTRKNKQQMAFLQLYDESGECEVVVFSKLYNSITSILAKNNILVVTGYKRKESAFNQDEQEEYGSYIANSIELLEEHE